MRRQLSTAIRVAAAIVTTAFNVIIITGLLLIAWGVQ